MAVSLPIHPLNERLFQLEQALEDTDLRLRALTASLDRVCLPLNLKKLRNVQAPDYLKTRKMVKELISSQAALRLQRRRLQNEYDQAFRRANRLSPS
jgi:hypothetical protein